MRIIMHIDMNSYFATAEQQTNPFLRGKPICVAGKGQSERTVCAAASIEAKKFGVKSGSPVWEAKALCPEIQIVPADYLKYEFISRKLIKIFEDYTPAVEIFSIDEAFLDLSHCFNTLKEAIPLVQVIKTRIREEIGDYLTCSAGIAPNKLLAKLASEKQKPDGLTIIESEEIKSVLKDTPIEDLCGIGRKIGAKLNLLGIKTVGELGECSQEKLTKFFGPHLDKVLKMYGLGLDPAPVVSFRDMPREKSFSHAYTLSQNLTDLEKIKKVLLKLAEKVGRRARRSGLTGKTISLYVRFFDFTAFGQMTTCPHFVDDGHEIYRIATQMLEKIKDPKPVRLIGVGLRNLSPKKTTSFSLLTIDRQKEQIVKTMDKINDRFGEFMLFRASLADIKDKIQEIPDGRRKRF